jgi:hypothetical protein
MSGGSGYGSYGSSSTMEREAKKRLTNEQMTRIRRAPSALDAIDALFPLAKVSSTKGPDTMGGTSGENKATYPADALMMAWARARHLGQLDSNVDRLSNSHSTYALAGGHGQTVHAALIRMARASGHYDLADAFAHTAERHGLVKDDKATLRALTMDHNDSARTLRTIQSIASRNKWLDSSIKDLKTIHGLEMGGPFAYDQSHSYYSYNGPNLRNNRSMGQILSERLPVKERAESQTKEAA